LYETCCIDQNRCGSPTDLGVSGHISKDSAGSSPLKLEVSVIILNIRQRPGRDDELIGFIPICYINVAGLLPNSIGICYSGIRLAN